MAKAIAEWILMKYFFPDANDKKKIGRYCEDFKNDMNFDLKVGVVTRATDKLSSIHPEKVSYNRINLQEEYLKQFNRLNRGDFELSDEDKNRMIALVEDFRFMTFNDLNAKDKNGQDIEDKLNLISQIKIKKVKAGTRIFDDD